MVVFSSSDEESSRSLSASNHDFSAAKVLREGHLLVLPDVEKIPPFLPMNEEGALRAPSQTPKSTKKSLLD